MVKARNLRQFTQAPNGPTREKKIRSVNFLEKQESLANAKVARDSLARQKRILT